MKDAFDKLDKSQLLGFDRKGDLLWDAIVAGASDSDDLGSISQALGPTKPVGVDKPAGTLKTG